MSLTDIELSLWRWSELRKMGGTAAEVPDALRNLFSAATPDAVRQAYWKLENHVVVQGQLFEAAEFVVPVLIAALLDERPRHVKIGVLELLYQIVAGTEDAEELQRGNTQLAERCRQRAREGLWVLYGELVSGSAGEAAYEVLQIIETDPKRLAAFSRTTE